MSDAPCQKCKSDRIFIGNAHAKDLHAWVVPHLDIERDGYLPEIPNIGSGDDMEIEVCLDCGQMQGTWPVSDDCFYNEDDEDEDDKPEKPTVPYASDDDLRPTTFHCNAENYVFVVSNSEEGETELAFWGKGLWHTNRQFDTMFYEERYNTARNELELWLQEMLKGCICLEVSPGVFQVTDILGRVPTNKHIVQILTEHGARNVAREVEELTTEE